MERWKGRFSRERTRKKDQVLDDSTEQVLGDCLLNFNSLLERAGVAPAERLRLPENAQLAFLVGNTTFAGKRPWAVGVTDNSLPYKKVKERIVETIHIGHFDGATDTFNAYDEVLSEDGADKLTPLARNEISNSRYIYSHPRLQEILQNQRITLLTNSVLDSILLWHNLSNLSDASTANEFERRPLEYDDKSSFYISISPNYAKVSTFAHADVAPLWEDPRIESETLMFTLYGGYRNIKGVPFRVKPLAIPFARGLGEDFAPIDNAITTEGLTKIRPLISQLREAEQDKTLRGFDAAQMTLLR